MKNYLEEDYTHRKILLYAPHMKTNITLLACHLLKQAHYLETETVSYTLTKLQFFDSLCIRYHNEGKSHLSTTLIEEKFTLNHALL